MAIMKAMLIMAIWTYNIFFILLLPLADGNSLLNEITSHQHPSPEECSTKRLLVIHEPLTDYFEGTGSIIKAITMGLAEAIHSNRILIWGHYIPTLFSRAHKEECYNSRQGGLYNCFFKHLSTCSLSHITDQELRSLALFGYNDSARVSLQQTRRGLAMYIPPPHYRTRSYMKYMWPSVLTAYIFRLKKKFPLNYEMPLYGIHMRHGDVKALSHVYRNRLVFPIEDYMEALKAAPDIPGTIYIASDSNNLKSEVNAARRYWGCTDLIPSLECPNFIVQPWLRTKYGSHLTAARGGCRGQACGLPPEVVIDLHDSDTGKQLNKKGLERGFEFQGISDSESHDVFRVVTETIYDIYILSRCTSIVGTGTSHFSTVSMFLSWYVNYFEGTEIDDSSSEACTDSNCTIGGASYFSDQLRLRFILLDGVQVSSGELESSFLLGTYRGQEAISSAEGYKRWASLEARFREDTVVGSAKANQISELSSDPTDIGLPFYPYSLFDSTAVIWSQIGEVFIDPVCSDKQPAEILIKNGADLSNIFPGRALICWINAIKNTGNPVYLDILEENIQAIQHKHFYLYAEAVRTIIRLP